jgi:Ca2+-binding RTX toxin-like protein
MEVREMKQRFILFLAALALGMTTLFSGGQVARADGCTFSAGVTQNATTITGTGGNDTINCSGAGHGHTINGGGGADTITGSNSADTINGEGGGDTLNGGGDNDVIDGGTGNDTINGQAGNDSLIGGAGNDALAGGTGDDTYSFSGAPRSTQTDAVTELADQGTDRLSFAGVSVGVTINLSADAPIATYGAAIVNAGGAGQAANFEDATGGSSADILIGNEGPNELDGGLGDDALAGDEGNDGLSGGNGNDFLAGGDGDDVYKFASTGGGIDTDTVVESADGGIDTLDFSMLPFSQPVNVNAAGSNTKIANHLGRTVHTLQSQDKEHFENVIGTPGDDSIAGNSSGNVLTGGSGNDSLVGHDGDDQLIGGLGDDVLLGRAGNDTFRGGEGGDLMHGGPGDDAYFSEAASAVEVDGAFEKDSEGTDTLHFSALPAGQPVAVNLTAANFIATHFNRFVAGALPSYGDIENVVGTPGDDAITGNGLVNSLVGSDGNDTISGGSNNDLLLGGAGADTLSGDDGADYLDGASGTDSLDGGAGLDACEDGEGGIAGCEL